MTPEEAYWEAMKAGKRLPELERFVLNDLWFSCMYAQYVIKGRWIKAEDVIITDPEYSYCYAFNVIKGKLPEKMHNMMFLHAIKDSDNWCVKQYFEHISK